MSFPIVRIHSRLTDRAAEEAALTPEQIAARRQQDRDQAAQETQDQIDADFEKSRPGQSPSRIG